MPRVFYFRVEDPGYPRNARIRAFLERTGFDITLHVRSPGPGRARLLRDLRALWRGSRQADLIVVSEMSLPIVPAAWAVGAIRRLPLVVDGFVGKYETDIVDHQLYSPRSPQAMLRRIIDRLSVRLATIHLVDTRIRAARLAARHPRSTIISLPVGAPDWARPGPRPASDASLRVLFYGSFLPLHGIPTILGAVAQAIETGSDILLTMVGSAPHAGGAHDAQAMAQRLGIRHQVRFVPSVPQEQLNDHIAANHVVLGLFGGSEKAGSVIANKVWQGLAAGRVVVTQSSAALKEVEQFVGDQLRTVPAGDPAALAQTLRDLAASPPGEYAHSWEPLEDYVNREFARLVDELRAARPAMLARMEERY